VQGFAAAFTWHVLRTLSVSRWAAVVAIVPVAMVPLGVEVVLSLANVQWFLLYMSLLAVVWTPRGWPGRLLQAVLLVLTAVSSPFGALPVAALAVRGLVTRSRGALAVAGVGLVATTIQLLAMRAAPSRGLHLAFDPANLIGTYLRRVVADGMIGVGRNGGLTYAPSIKAGLACTAVVVLLAALGVWRFGRRAAVVMAALFGLSVVAFLAPSVLEGVAGTDPLFQGRYMVAPALLWLAMTAVALSAASRVTGVTRLAVRALCAVVVLGVLVAAVLSYPVRVDGREGVTPWLPQLTTDAASCAASPGATIVVLEVAPRGWTSHLTCSQILDW
jgi:hypothetical protein